MQIRALYHQSSSSVFCVFLSPRGLLYTHRHRDVETETRTFYELPLPLNNNTLHATFVIKMRSFEGLDFSFFLLGRQNFTPPHCQISSNAMEQLEWHPGQSEECLIFCFWAELRLVPPLPQGRRSPPPPHTHTHTLAAGWLTTNLYDAVIASLWLVQNHTNLS